MKWIKSLNDLKEHIFSNKERKIDTIQILSLEKPRELYLRTCSEIAKKLEGHGFKYFPSQQKLLLVSSDNKYSLSIKFSSNPDNVANKYVELKGSFSVDSKDLKKYTKENPLIDYWNETLIGLDLGVLIDNNMGNAVWNLVHPDDYDSAIEVLPKICSTKLISYFDQLQNPSHVITEIKNKNFDLQSPICTVQYLLLHEHRFLAQEYLLNFLEEKKKLIYENYIEAKSEINREGFPQQYVMGHGYGYDIALVEMYYNLN